MKRPVVHFEIGCDDLEKISSFYRRIFGWESSPNGDNALTIDTHSDAGIPGHFTQLTPKDPQKFVNVYIETDTLKEDLQAIEGNGGKVQVPPIELPDGRVFAWFQDIAGNTVGLITPSRSL